MRFNHFKRVQGTRLIVSFVVCLLIFGGGFWRGSTRASSPKIAVASAFAAELTPLIEKAEITQTEEIGGVIFQTGTLEGQQVVLFNTGVSMVNAAMNMQRAVDHYDLTAIVFTGIGGGLSPDAQIGDVVIPAQWGQYQESVYARMDENGRFILPSWLDTPLAAFGMMFPKAVTIQGKAYFWFKADTSFLQDIASLDDDRIFVGGNGVSGQAFMDNADFADYLYQMFGAQVVDMESAAVAQVAVANELPFVIVRGISDIPGETDENEMRDAVEIAAENAANVVISLLGSQER